MGAKHTPGPLVARRINDSAKPFAVINPHGRHGDEIVAGYCTEADAVLFAAAPEMFSALKAILRDGDGHDDFEAHWPAIHAAIAKAEGRS
jgi:hypothetical protein